MNYPASIGDIDRWAKANGLKPHEGRKRFVEYLILQCVSSEPRLHTALVLKGGNALRFAHRGTRSTLDLDFTADTSRIPDDEDALRAIVEPAMKHAHNRFSVKLKCQTLRRNPPNPAATKPTYSLTIAYQFPTDRYYHNFEERKNLAETVPVEISLNDLVCETVSHEIGMSGGPSQTVRVCSLEDIVAEKLRSLLQQPIRNRHRRQDVYDIARAILDHGDTIDHAKVSRFFVQKSVAREITPKKSSFDETIRSMAEFDYDIQLKRDTGDRFVPFDDGWRIVLEFVRSLEIDE